MKLKNSETYVNLARAFAAECQARAKYEFIEYGARMNDYKNIADVIDEIAYQEFNHARMFYTFIQEGEDKCIDNIDISAGYPFREKWDLLENLRLASLDEEGDGNRYGEFAAVAEKEGFPEIANLFIATKEVEFYHKQIFLEMYEQMKNGTLYEKEKPVTWVCADCGYMTEGKIAWDECPLCKAKRGSIKLILEAKLINARCCQDETC